MNLLLLLSALLSALTGIAGGARAAEQPAVVRPLTAAAARPAARVAVPRWRPAHRVVARPAVLPLPRAFALPALILERTLRRRE